MDDYSSTKKSLIEVGLDISDLERAQKVLTVLKKEKFDSSRILSKLSTVESLDKKVSDRFKVLEFGLK